MRFGSLTLIKLIGVLMAFLVVVFQLRKRDFDVSKLDKITGIMVNAGTVDSDIPPFTKLNESFRLVDEDSSSKIESLLSEKRLRCIKGGVASQPVFIITRESDSGHYLIYGKTNETQSVDDYKVYSNGWVERRRKSD